VKQQVKKQVKQQVKMSSALTVENIRKMMEELLAGYALVKGQRLLATSPVTTEDEEESDNDSEYSDEEDSEEEEEHARKLKRVEETLRGLEMQVNRIAAMQEKRLATF
jgi:hypothetical protein